MSRSTRHPIFARVYQRVASTCERAGAAEHRERFLAGLAGRVVEVGAGNGLNFAHYPDAVTEVVAVEPEPFLRARAAEHAKLAPVSVTVIGGNADEIPLPDASVDAAVASLVLCSVPDQRTALAELFRVVRPGGQLRFYEHVAATDAHWSRLQRRAEHVWPLFAGGCHLCRDTEQAIIDAGFEIEDCDRFLFAPCWTARFAAPHILGSALRPT
jgi:ubiquinone/menaquinone biosynthesis C-methylase UbiE